MATEAGRFPRSGEPSVAPRRCRGTRCGRHEDRSEWDRQRPGPGVEDNAWSSRGPRRGAGSPRRRGPDEGFPGRDVNPNPTRVLGISVGVGSWPLGPTWLVLCIRSSSVNKVAIDVATLLWFEQESGSISFQEAPD